MFFDLWEVLDSFKNALLSTLNSTSFNIKIQYKAKDARKKGVKERARAPSENCAAFTRESCCGKGGVGPRGGKGRAELKCSSAQIRGGEVEQG